MAAGKTPGFSWTQVMPDKIRDLLSTIPGFGAIAVAIVAIFAAFDRKTEKPSADKSAPMNAAERNSFGSPFQESSSGFPDPVRFLFEKGIVREEPARFALAKEFGRLIPEEAGTAKPVKEIKSVPEKREIDPTEHIEWMIANVPDPDDTQMGFRFDQILDAILRANSDDDHYSIEHFWLPWKRFAEKPSDIKTAGGPTSFPGMLIFRGKGWGEETKRRIVLLVGENPVNGVRPEAFQFALDLIWQATTNSKKPKFNFNLVAPFSTGGQKSVLEGIAKWRNGDESRKPARFRCYSGSANGIRKFTNDNVEPTTEHKKPGDFDFDAKESPKTLAICERESVTETCVEIRTTQAPTELLETAALQFFSLPKMPMDLLIKSNDLVVLNKSDWPVNINKTQVAFFVESNSGYGSQAESAWDPNDREKGHRPWLFRFPMHISQLTGMQSKERRERELRFGLTPRNADMMSRLDQSRNGSDVLPAADEQRTVLINQRLIEDFLFVIKRERVRYVGIMASNPLDKIYLVEQIKKECPLVQIFILGSDLLYGHPAYLDAMRGVIISSMYPLNPSIQQWEKPVGDDFRRIPFTSYSSEGIYNAILALRSQDCKGDSERQNLMLDYDQPFFGGDPRGKPPIWITVIGENSRFVPLAYFPDYEDGGLVFRKDPFPAEASPVYTPPQLGPVRAVPAILVLCALSMLWLMRKTRLSNLTWYSQPKPCYYTQYTLMRRHLFYYVFAVGLIVAVLPCAKFFAVAWDATALYDNVDWLLIEILILVTGMVFIQAVLLLLVRPVVLWISEQYKLHPWISKQYKLRPPHSTTRLIQALNDRLLSCKNTYGGILIYIVGFFSAAVVLYFVRFLIFGHESDSPQNRLYLERFCGLTSGYSPLLPCFTIGLGLGSAPEKITEFGTMTNFPRAEFALVFQRKTLM